MPHLKPELRSCVVLYHAEHGHIIHIHYGAVGLHGTTITDEELERHARETALQYPAYKDIPLLALRVDPQAIPREGAVRVDVNTKSLVPVPA
jgi:hypothetical protein